MADAISIQELIDARTDAKTLEEAVNGDAVTTVLSRLGETYPTLSNALNQIDSKLDSADAQVKQGITDLFQNGGLPATPFKTKALMTASALANDKYAMVTDDTVNNGLYVKTSGTWVKSSYDPLTQAKQYADVLSTTELSITTDLNTLAAGNYFLSTPNLNALVNAGNFIELGYPADTAKSGGVKLNVVRKNTSTYQTLEFTSQGRILTRQGVIGGSFYEWVEVGVSVIDQEIAKKFGSITAGTSLNTFINAGTWGISGSTVFVGSRDPEMGYPEELSSLSAVLTVAQTESNYAVQEFTHGTLKYKRVLHRATGAVYNDWEVLGAEITDYAKKGDVANFKDLNIYVDEGIFACASPVLSAGLLAGDLNYPNFFERVGGGILIVAKSGNFPYQVFIATQQKKIAVRQYSSTTIFSPWVDMLGITSIAKSTVLTYGSSTMVLMADKIKNNVEPLGATYVSDAIGAQVLETMQAHQGSNPISIVFNGGVTALNNVASAVTVTQKDDLGSLRARGSFTVTLSNGLKGTLNLDGNTFTASNATEVYIVESDEIKVDFGYSEYRNNAVHLINIGKNNITSGYSAQVVFDNTVKMIEYIESANNDKFVVAGHFVNTGASQAQKDVVLQVNALLKRKYGAKYFDMQDYLMSAQIWTDLNITPTQDDLDKQAAGELAISLIRDAGHLSAAVDTIFASRIVNRLQALGYLT